MMMSLSHCLLLFLVLTFWSGASALDDADAGGRPHQRSIRTNRQEEASQEQEDPLSSSSSSASSVSFRTTVPHPEDVTYGAVGTVTAVDGGAAVVPVSLPVPAAVAYGRPLRQQQQANDIKTTTKSSPFFLLNSYTNFNHGSFGACPQFVLDYQRRLQQEQDKQPDVWFRQRIYQLQNITRPRIAKYVQLMDATADDTSTASSDAVDDSSSPEDSSSSLVLVESASTAVNSILRSFPWHPRDILVHFSVAYPMIHNTAAWLAKRHDLQIVVVPISFPLVEDNNNAGQEFLDAMKHALRLLADENVLDNLKMIVLDHIASAPAVKEPINELAAMIKKVQPRCFVLVDGAHAMGQIMPTPPTPKSKGVASIMGLSNIDAYLSNGHKWLYSPKGSAFLWINTTSGFVTDTFPEPTVISSANKVEYGQSIVDRYSYVSTRDYTAGLSMDAALDFRQDLLGGDEAIYQYCRTLALQAKHYLMDLWKISKPLVPDALEEFMINVPLPTHVVNSTTQAKQLQVDYLLQQHGIYMIVLLEPTSGIYFTRLSAQVYLELWDFQRLGHLVLEFGNEQAQAQ
jgi:selenocysteine lyase/cysteine desulfurase